MQRDTEPKTSGPRELDTLQRWMQAVITHPEGIDAGVADEGAQQEIALGADQLEQVILPSRNLSSAERLAVYGNAYYARLLECLRSMFPALANTLGEEAFDSFALAYLQRYPSRSYTLDRLADRFADFLQETRPELLDDGEAEDEADASPSWPDLLVDLARLETAIEQVFDGPGAEDLPLVSADQIAALDPEAWSASRLLPAPGLRLLEFKFPLNEFYSAARASQEPESPDPAPSYLALWRRNYVVRRLPLSCEQFVVLSAILAGNSVGDSLAAGAEAAEDFDAFAASLGDWFRQWTAAGFFVGVKLAK